MPPSCNSTLVDQRQAFKYFCHYGSWEYLLNNFVQRESITVWLTSSLTGLDATKQVNLLINLSVQSNRIQTSKTGGQLYRDTSPYKVNEYYLARPNENRPCWLLCAKPCSLLAAGDEGQLWSKVAFEPSLLFRYLMKAYHLGPYEPSSPPTKDTPRLDPQYLVGPTIL